MRYEYGGQGKGEKIGSHLKKAVNTQNDVKLEKTVNYIIIDKGLSGSLISYLLKTTVLAPYRVDIL